MNEKMNTRPLKLYEESRVCRTSVPQEQVEKQEHVTESFSKTDETKEDITFAILPSVSSPEGSLIFGSTGNGGVRILDLLAISSAVYSRVTK